MKTSILQKFSLTSLFLVITTAVVVGGLFYQKTTDLLVENAVDDIAKDVRSAGDQLLTITSSHNEDVLFLANTPPIQGILRAKSAGGIDTTDNSNYEQWVSRLEAIFKSYLSRKPSTIWIRFMDNHGQELVSVGRSSTDILVYRGERLQNKGERTYFKKARELPSGEVYISEINLNREFGKIIKPHQEVIRNATPIYDKRTGEIAGVMSITSQIGDKFNEIRWRYKNAITNIYITNDAGGYLLHPESDKTYGFDLGKRYRIQEDFPKLAPIYLAGNTVNHKIIITDSGKNARVVNFTKIPFDATNPRRFIAVVISQQYAGIVSNQSRVVRDLLVLIGVLVALGVLIALALAYRFASPIKQMTLAIDKYKKTGNSNVKLPVHYSDEVGALAKSFDSMIHEVEKSQNLLRENNTDLEQQVRERTELLESSERYQRTILQSIADAVITIDGDGVINGFNPAAEEMFGYRFDEVSGKDIAILLPDDFKERHQHYLQNSKLHSSRIIDRSRELIGVCKDGTEMTIELNVSSLDVDGKKGYVGVLRDMTERNRAREELLSALDQAKQANKAKSEFLSSMSHELRTPLNAVMGFSQILMIDQKNPITDNQMVNVKEIYKAGEHLLGLINELLDLARIESGHIDLDIESVKPGAVLAECLPLIAQLAENRGIQVELFNNSESINLDKLSNLSVCVHADKTRLKQVFLNLLSNAIKYNRENGMITIYVQRYPETTRISITDTGEGLSQEKQKRLFKAFERLEQDKSATEGTGIGLVITKNLIELMHGKIGMESQKGVGSTFWIELPNIATVLETGSLRRRNTVDISNHGLLKTGMQHSILYIEDNPANLRLVTNLLENQDNIVTWSAHEPQLGLDLAFANQPDLILLDINLPGMDGYDVLRRLQEHPQTRRIPVIAISANAMSNDIQRGKAAGFFEYITKPINIVELLDAIEAALKIHRPGPKKLLSN